MFVCVFVWLVVCLGAGLCCLLVCLVLHASMRDVWRMLVGCEIARLLMPRPMIRLHDNSLNRQHKRSIDQWFGQAVAPSLAVPLAQASLLVFKDYF